jgi:Amt family ammonium transporter
MDPAVDKLWLFTATLLILLMQVGFLLLEGGRVRSKNAINVAQKNVSDLMVCWITFTLFGFTVMFGAQMPASGDAYPSPLDFMFQLGFCATAASIISGGIAERMSFRAYLVLALLIGGFLYPITGRLVWGNNYDTGVTAWLADLGFVDFAGSTVVHSVGAWAALVGILLIGHRTDRFDAAGKPRVMASHSSIMSLHGVMLLMLGWLGFNAGAVSVSDPAFSQILMNTLSAAAFGSAGGSILGLWLDKGVFNPSRTMNGIIGGLVSCTAAVHVMSPYEAVFAGLSGGALATGAAHYLLFRLRFDDPVDVVATHGLAGVYGTLLYAFVAPSSALVNGSQISQFAIQATGVILVFMMITSGTWVTLKLTARYIPLRVKPEEEALGLNYTEHGEAIGTDRLRNALQGQIEGTSGFARAIELDQDDEHADLAAAVNTLIVRQEEVTEEIRQSEQRFRQFAATASDWLWECDREGNLVSVEVADVQHSQIGSLDWSSLTLFEFANVLPENDVIVRTAMNLVLC